MNSLRPHLNSLVLAPDKITEAQKKMMFELLKFYFWGVEWEVFTRDLANKDHVILLLNPEDEIVGFTTQVTKQLPMGNQIYYVHFSGDTITDKNYRYSAQLSRAGFQLAIDLKKKYQTEHYYWLLISKGYRTYKYLPTFFKEYYPSYAQPTPATQQKLMHAAASLFFGECYNKETGLVLFSANPQRLKPEVGDITHALLKKPYIAFFQDKNPQHLLGYELVCWAHVSENNFSEALVRLLQNTHE